MKNYPLCKEPFSNDNGFDFCPNAEFRANESYECPQPRCGFCSAPVDGDTTSIALESEAYVSHPDSIIRRIPGTTDTEVFSCNDGTGCAK
jgi:hypothetical protein